MLTGQNGQTGEHATVLTILSNLKAGFACVSKTCLIAIALVLGIQYRLSSAEMVNIVERIKTIKWYSLYMPSKQSNGPPVLFRYELVWQSSVVQLDL